MRLRRTDGLRRSRLGSMALHSPDKTPPPSMIDSIDHDTQVHDEGLIPRIRQSSKRGRMGDIEYETFLVSHCTHITMYSVCLSGSRKSRSKSSFSRNSAGLYQLAPWYTSKQWGHVVAVQYIHMRKCILFAQEHVPRVDTFYDLWCCWSSMVPQSENLCTWCTHLCTHKNEFK